MVLFHALHSLAGKARWKISVAHFNHRLRGRSSDADEKLVRQTAAALKLPFAAGGADVKTFARESRLSVEMAARKLRHEFLARAARERKIPAVALAHQADDQVELFFLRVLRGAGGEGVAGMKWRAPSPVNPKITLVRPLLGFSKAEIVSFARANKIPFRVDVSNVSNDFLRNRIRNELLPLLRKNYQAGLNRTVLRLMEIVGADSDFAGRGASRLRLVCVRPLAGRRLFGDWPVAVQRRVLRLQLGEAGIAADFDLIESLRQSPDQFVSVGPETSVARDRFGEIKLRTEAEPGFNAGELAVKLAGQTGEAVFAAVRLAWKFDARNQFERSRGKTGGEFFDAEKVGKEITLRHWRPGDLFQPIGLPAPAKLQDLFTNAKIPRARRHRLIVAAAAGGEIFWVEGLRISGNFKLTPETRRRLAWRWRRLQIV